MTKNWFITGASSGLGRGMTQRLLARGDRVVATVRKAGVLDDLIDQHGDRLHVVECDLTRVDTVRAAVAQAFAWQPRVDVVVSNAGYGLFGAAEELDDAQINRQIATNLTGSIQLIRAVLPRLREQGGGRIVQISSEGGRIGYPAFSVYHATKWGIEGFIESVAKEVRPFGIDFVMMEPGATRTNFGTGLDRAETMQVYEATPVGEIRRALEAGYFEFADSAKTVDAMIAAMDSGTPPLRLALGRSAYESIRASLIEQLEILEAQKAISLSVMS